MTTRQEHWLNYEQGSHIVFDVAETGKTTEPTGTVEISYELWTDILGALGFKPELNALDAESDT